MLVIEDSAGRARAWLGVETSSATEKGARLVFYDDKGRARLAVRFADKVLDDPYGNGARAEVTPGQVADETYLPPPCPVGQPPSEETELKQRVKHAAHVAAVSRHDGERSRMQLGGDTPRHSRKGGGG